MHQHPRHPPPMASPATSDQTNPSRTNNPRDRDLQSIRANSPLTQGSGSSEDFASARQEQAPDNPAAQMQRLNQVIQNFHTKATLIILHSRVDLAPAYSKSTETKRVNKWFNIELEETDEYRYDIKRWKTCDLKEDRPPPLVIEIFLTTEMLHQSQRLVILDDDGKRWDVMQALAATGDGSQASKNRVSDPNQVLLERWTIELGDTSISLPPDLSTILPLVYKKSIVLFRSLYTYSNLLPTFKLSRKIGKGRSHMAMKLGYRIADGLSVDQSALGDSLKTPLCDSSNEVVADYSFGITDSPAGPFSVRVQYRQNCDFRIDDSEELLSSRFLGADVDLFRPSLREEQAPPEKRPETEVGSLPADQRRHLIERPELGHAYGSLSTFHQAGIATGTSPISALRNAQDFTTSSPPTPDPPRPTMHAHTSSQGSRNTLRAQAAGRRSSFSFQPFKAPVLSASPLGASPLGSSPRTHSGRVPVLGSLTEESGLAPPNALTVAARKPASLAPEQPVASSTSSSPKPTPVRYSSSFSHRRARLSSGGPSAKVDEDQTSSGKGSASSSTVQPGSGLMAEAAAGGGSSGSMQEDDENISEFLKMLDLKKDLLTSTDAVAAEKSTRRTTAALNKFHRMRDSNAALSDSMSSSLMLQRSSTSSSRQLSSVPAMVAATSASTSSSPGKPISPHTPHTPFAPSRLSAAYSHDDTDTQHHLTIEEEPPSPSEATTSETAQGHSTAHVPAIDIPNSPRPFLPNYRRSSSAQRRPLSSEDDIGDLYGMRSASMGAPERRSSRRPTAHQDEHSESTSGAPEAVEDSTRPPLDASPHRSSFGHRQAGLPVLAADGAGSDSGSGKSSAHVYRSRLARGGAGRGGTTPHGSTSSFGGTGGSIERGGESGSASGSWGRGGRRSESRPENRFDEDEFLPFAMEKSDLTPVRKTDNTGLGGR